MSSRREPSVCVPEVGFVVEGSTPGEKRLFFGRFERCVVDPCTPLKRSTLSLLLACCLPRDSCEVSPIRRHPLRLRFSRCVRLQRDVTHASPRIVLYPLIPILRIRTPAQYPSKTLGRVDVDKTSARDRRRFRLHSYVVRRRQCRQWGDA